MCLLSAPYVWTRNTIFLTSCYQAQPVCLVVKVNRYYSDYRIYLSFPIICVVFLLPTGSRFSSVFRVLVQMRSTAIWFLKGFFWKALNTVQHWQHSKSWIASRGGELERHCGLIQHPLKSVEVFSLTESVKSRENLGIELFL